MALTIGDNFSYQGAKPLDARLVYDTIAQMKAKPDSTLYAGIIAFCKADGKNYQWKPTNTVDATLGKWREFESGSGGSDNVVEGYRNPSDGLFYEESAYVTAIIGAGNIIYIDIPNNLPYRWDGSDFVYIGGGGSDNVIDGYRNLSDGLFYKESSYTTAIAGAGNTIYIDIPSNSLYRWDGIGFVPVKDDGSDNIVEGYRNPSDGLFYEESSYTTAITGSDKVIYIDLPNNTQYRWDGTGFVFIGGAGDTIQVVTLPIASSSELGKIYQYIGTSTTEYINGYFYECVEDAENPGNYIWEQKSVQPGSGDLKPSDVQDIKNNFIVIPYVVPPIPMTETDVQAVKDAFIIY